MSQDESGSKEEVISLKTLDQEIRTVRRAAELRIRELTKLTEAYAAGEITPAEATEKYMHHLDKWGDALPGVTRAAQNLTDEEITADMERAMKPHLARIRRDRPRQQGAGRPAAERD
jgi:hypothetical protein